MKYISLFDKKTFKFALMFLIIFVAFGLLSFYRLQDQLIKHNFTRLVNISRNQEIKINIFFENIHNKLKGLSNSPTLRNKIPQLISNKLHSDPILDELFANYFSGYGLIGAIVLDHKGNVLYQYSNELKKLDLMFVKENFRSITTDSVHLSELYFDEKNKKSLFNGKVLISYPDYKQFEVVTIFDARKSFFNILKSDLEQLSGFEALLVQVKDNIVTYISDSRYLGDIAFKLQGGIYFLNLNKRDKDKNESFFEGLDYRGMKVFAYITHLSRWDWYLMVKIDQDEIIKEIKKYYFSIFGTIVLVTFVFLVTMSAIMKKEKEELIKQTDALKKQKDLIKKQYDYITKIANDAIVISDLYNRIIDFNDKFIEFYKIDKPELMSLNLLDYFSDGLKNQWDNYLKNIRENNGLVFESVHRKTDGEFFHVQISAKEVEIEGNEFLILIIRDFEERKRMEDELRSAINKAEESDKLKSNFLSMMSHEVRTPVNIILGAVDILKSNLDQKLITDNEHLFEMITRNNKRLLTLISDIIDISRIETNELKLEFVIRNTESLIVDVLSDYDQVAKNKGLKLITDFKATNPYVRLDEIRFQQVITNLISNAIKFTSSGGVTISTKNIGDNLHISVKDTGIGIPKSALNDIFKMFRQAHEGYSRNFEGAGLGLTISQKLTRMMGGEISVESEVNVGSTFTLVFPVVKSDELDENLLKLLEERHKTTSKPTILIVDNNNDDRFYLESLMVRLNVEFFTIPDGKKIISILKHRTVDCVIYSINLQNELEAEKVIDEIRNKVKLSNLKLIALMAPSTIISEHRLLEIGVNQVKPKPISFEELSRTLMQVLAH